MTAKEIEDEFAKLQFWGRLPDAAQALIVATGVVIVAKAKAEAIREARAALKEAYDHN